MLRASRTGRAAQSADSPIRCGFRALAPSFGGCLGGRTGATIDATDKELAMHDAPILICYDGTESAHRAIDAAADLLGPRRAVVLDVGPPITPAESLAVLSPVTPGAAFEELNLDDAAQRARVGSERARHAGFTAEARSTLGAPTWEGIVDIADEIDAAVIVLGSRGLSGVREVFEGSVSHQVAEHAHRPVLIVPPTNGHR
jgi:nucleotide-binding universal stress UspA family protein